MDAGQEGTFSAVWQEGDEEGPEDRRVGEGGSRVRSRPCALGSEAADTEGGRSLRRPTRVVISAVSEESPALSTTVRGADLDEEMWRVLGEVGVDEVGELGELQTKCVFA